MPESVRFDERDAKAVVQLLEEAKEICQRNRWPHLLLAIPVGEGGRIDRYACSGLVERNPEVAQVVQAAEEGGYVLLRCIAEATKARRDWKECMEIAEKGEGSC